MKKNCSKSFLILLCFQLFTLVSLAQESYEIITFTIPKDWQREIHPNSLSLIKADETGGNGGIITIFKPDANELGSKTNFAIWWNSVVRKVVNTTETPQMQPVSNLNGWKVECGIAQFTSENKELNLGKGMAVLCSFSGTGKVVNVMALSNSKAINDEIFEFVDSVNLPEADLPELVAPLKDVHGIWERSRSDRPSYADAIKWGKLMTTTSRYNFTYGEYTFTEKLSSNVFPQIIVVNETGTYDLDGDEVTLRPQKSTVQHYQKGSVKDEPGKLLKTENRALEIVKYRFTFHYFEDVKSTKLVLQTDLPTKRDGEFSHDKTYKNAWYFDDKYLDDTSSKPKAQ